jgi:FkbM family methyltransferase
MKILFITPHLSTGGGPQYLLKKIDNLKNDCDIYCVEYNDVTGGVLTVQRKQIEVLLGNKLITLSHDKNELINVIKNLNPEVIHFEEMPEYFCDIEISKLIYSKDRTYKIIETSHDSSFNPQNKIFFPDYFSFVSEFQKKLFSSLNIPSEVVEYPIEYKNKTDRKAALLQLDLNPKITHFLNVGLFTSRKNQKEIIEYARELLNEPVQFHFIGNQADNFKSYWEPLMKDFPSNCKWWGERKDVDTFYNAMDVFLFASKGSDNDKETSPLVLKEAIGWHLPILMYNLPVYCNMYDKYAGISYLKNSKEENLTLIKQFIREKLDFYIRYNEQENRIYITFAKNELLDGKDLKIVLKDSHNLLTNYVFKTKYQSGFSYWISSNANINLFNGFLIEVYENYNLLFSESVKDFKREIKIEPKINKKLSHDPFDYSAWWSFYEIFIKKEYDLVKEGDFVVDIGANIGLFSLFAALKGASKILSIEPDKRNCIHLKENLNQFSEITIVEEAVSDKDGYVEFFTSEISSINSTIKNDENFSSFTKDPIQSYKVPCLSPSSLIDKYNITKIDFLKIDCEGGEFAFFENLDIEFLTNKISKIVCEVHKFAGSQIDYENKIKSKLIKCGFSVQDSNSLNEKSVLVFTAIKI